MVYKFRSLREPDLTLKVKDIDGDEVTVQFQKYNNGLGLFETEETKIAEGMLKSKKNGVDYMDADYVKRNKGKAEAKPKVAIKSAPKTPKTSNPKAKAKPKAKRKSSTKK